MFYNQNRPHTALDDKTPNEFYFDNLLISVQKSRVGINARLPLEIWKIVQSSEATSETMPGKSTVSMSTDEIMKLTRGE